MAVIYIAGASDDLIEIDGDLQDEFLAIDLGETYGGYLAFSDGSIIRVVYDNGIWRITPTFIDPDSEFLKEYEAEEGSDDPEEPYSDVARLSNSYGFKWVVLGKEYSKRRRSQPQ